MLPVTVDGHLNLVSHLSGTGPRVLTDKERGRKRTGGAAHTAEHQNGSMPPTPCASSEPRRVPHIGSPRRTHRFGGRSGLVGRIVVDDDAPGHAARLRSARD